MFPEYYLGSVQVLMGPIIVNFLKNVNRLLTNISMACPGKRGVKRRGEGAHTGEDVFVSVFWAVLGFAALATTERLEELCLLLQRLELFPEAACRRHCAARTPVRDPIRIHIDMLRGY